LTSFEREKLRPARESALVVALLGIGVVALALWAGRETTAVLALLVLLAYVGAIWSIALRIPWLTALLISGAALVSGILVGYPLVGAIAAVVLFAWLAFQAGLSRSLNADSLRTLDPDAVDPEAVAGVAAYEALGFERAGAYGFEPAPGKEVVATLLIGPASDRYVVVTDLVMDVVSWFGERSLVTRNSASAPLPADCLANDLRGAEPAELADGHSRALEVLAARGLTPDRIRREDVLERQLAFERVTLEWARSRMGRTKTASFFRSGAGFGALTDDASGRQRIDAWLTATNVAL